MFSKIIFVSLLCGGLNYMLQEVSYINICNGDFLTAVMNKSVFSLNSRLVYI